MNLAITTCFNTIASMKPAFAAWLIVTMLGGPSSAAAMQRPAKTAIHGIVLTKGTNEPIAGAWVILDKYSAKESLYAAYLTIPITPSATTDRDGRFEIHDIDPASYKLTIRRDGYARQVYGQRVENGNVPPIELSAGESRDLVIHLTPAGSLSGVIRDASGRPVAGTNVDLIRRSYTSKGSRSFDTVSQTRTSDRGEYRFYWITPGPYYVRAGEGPYVDSSTGIEQYDEAVRRGSNEVRTEYPKTYYPGVREVEKAIAIDVQPRSELRGMDITVERRRQFHVRVDVIDTSTGQPPLEGMVSVMGSAGNGYGEPDVRLDRDLAPGIYWIGFGAGMLGESHSTPATPMAFAKVVVTDSDVELTLRAVLPPVIKGRVTVDGELPVSPKLDEVSIQAQTVGDVQFEGLSFSYAKADADGTFALNGIPNGVFRVAPLGLPPGFYLKEARLDGVDALNSPASFSNASRLDIVISSRGGQIDGTVRDDRSNPMPNVQAVLVPDSPRNRPELFQSVDTDFEGNFTMTDIAPGDYRLFAWEALEPYAWFDPEVLAHFESSSKPIHVSESSVQKVQLRMIPDGGAK